MPQAKFYNKKSKETEELMTDYFNCGICGCDNFSYEINPFFLSGKDDKEFLQHCFNCGNMIKTDRKDYLDKRKDYVLYEEGMEATVVEATPKKVKGFKDIKPKKKK